jgi:hypothetical protein
MNQIYTGRFYLSAIVFNQWRFFYQNFELQGSLRALWSFFATLGHLYIRPQMDFAISVWRPLYKKDQLLLERVQHAVTRWSPDLSHLPYEERLQILNIPQLED